MTNLHIQNKPLKEFLRTDYTSDTYEVEKELMRRVRGFDDDFDLTNDFWG